MNALLCSDRGSPSGFADRSKPFKWKVASKVTASEPVPVDTVSENVSVEDLLESVVGGKRERQFNRIGLSHGLVVPEYAAGFLSEPRGAWIKHLRLAANVHFQNVAVEVAKGGRRIRVRVVADVKVGEEIQLWFSPEVLMAMQIPFLSPANIKGQNSYSCHLCSEVFEDPNPLKLHLARNCDSLPLDIIWQRLRSFLLPETIATTTTPTRTAQSPPTTTPPPHCPANHTHLHPHSHHRVSAFHPVNHQAPTTPFNYSDPDHLAASHLETIVSNMGTSKQGHLCIYCGKLYSRKYGLKIHIRTHTGFKPLKCKFCHRPFGDPSNLNKHIRLHLQNQSPTSAVAMGTGTSGAHANFYKCHLCSKIMMRKRDLQRHIEMRHFPHDLHSHPQSVRGSSSDSVSNISTNSTCSSSNEEEEEDVDMEDPEIGGI